MLRRRSFYISTGIILLALSAIFISSRETDEELYKKEFREHYRVYAVAAPSNLNFCDEKTPLNDFEVYERFDREILVNTYFQSQTLMNLKRANRYFPVIEKILKRNGVPDDFKYVCMIESNLSNVVSPSNAAGFWQFLDATGKSYGLEINEEVDERYDLEKSTEAACKYFNAAYKEFGSWTMAAASYNMGIGGLRKAADTQGSLNYYDLLLNNETSRYVMRILAVKEIWQHPKVYGYYLTKRMLYAPIPTYSEEVNTAIPDLVAYAREHNLSFKTFKTLNPWLRKSKLSNPEGKSYTFLFPQSGYELMVNENYGFDAPTDSSHMKIEGDSSFQDVPDTAQYVEIEHVVQKGEDINKLSEKYHCSVPLIMVWNNMKQTHVRKGQIIKIPVRKDQVHLVLPKQAPASNQP